MQKLVFVHSWGDEGCCGTSTIPFEYESKEQFCFDVWEKVKLLGKISKDSYYVIDVLGCSLTPSNVEYLEDDIYTLEEWFNKEKIIKIF